MAAVAREMSSFALPATQNTAPVHEYRCLYTHDVRKKAKKWHDGSARFHTFNKRVMVYDDTKNYVGDLHYRADEDFGEGIELHLDRGVLVEVGERLGETQTDLTGIVHKSHADGATSSASVNVLRKPVQRTTELNAQGRPKSLIELLGTSQSRRANSQHTSPFEQRRALLEIQHVESRLKRRKISSGKENDVAPEQFTARPLPVQRPFLSNNGCMSTLTPCMTDPPRATASSTTAVSNGNQRVIDISSDDELPKARKPASKKSRQLESSTAQTRKEKDCSTPKPDRTKRSTNKSTSHFLEQQRPTSRVTETSSTSLAQTASRSSDASADSRSKPRMGSLRMVSQNPRPKLMYKALLPSNSVNHGPEMASARTVIQGSVSENRSMVDQNCDSVSSVNIEIADQTPELDALDEIFSPTGLPLRCDTAPKTPRRSSLTSRELQPPQLSPLFVSQVDSQRSPSPPRTFPEDDFPIPATQEPAAEELHNTETPGLDVIQEKESTPQPDSPCFPQPPSRFRTAKEDTSTTISPPAMPNPPDHMVGIPEPVQHSPSPMKIRAFARSLSEHDSPLPCDPRTTPLRVSLHLVEEQSIKNGQSRSPLPLPLPPLLAPPLQRPSVSPSKSPLQRSRSDTAALVPTTPIPNLPASTEEQGPWTGLEAFLLFDKWPACKAKNKPVFQNLPGLDDAMVDSDFDGDDGIDPTPPISRIMPVIRSARSVLRDG